MAIDALSDRFESLWRVGELSGPVRALARGSTSLSLLVGVFGQTEHWRYELPSMLLRQRYELFKEDGLERLWAVLSKDHFAVAKAVPGAPEEDQPHYVVSVGTNGPLPAWWSRRLEGPLESLAIHDRAVTVVTVTAEGRRVLFFRWPGPMDGPAVALELVGARFAAVRRYANTFCVTDDCGRLLVLSAEDLRLVREAKV